MPKDPSSQVELPRSSPPLGSTIAEVVDRELKACLDHAAEGLHFVGPDGTILWANQTELDLLGYSREEYIGHNITEFHADPPVIEDILARLTRGETLLNYEARLQRKDGSIRFVHINSNVLWRDDQFLHTRCFTRDITDRKAADELARRLADIVEYSEDAVISQDLDGRITSWNPAAERMYGHAAAEVIGQSIRLIIPPEREHEETEAVLRVRNGERVPTFETLRQHKTGALIDVALTVSPIRGRDGRVVGASKTARNIAARKRLEARDRFLVELDDLVRPLTDAEDITFTAARALGKHLGVNRCAYATVEDDEDTFLLTGNYNHGVGSIVGRYTFRQFGAECLRLMRAGEAYVVEDSENDPRITQFERPSYEMTAIRAVICVPILKQGRFVAAMAVHSATTRPWRPDEVELVQRVASRCWESIERARVTRELRESEHLFRVLANSIANLAWMARPDGWIYWYNEQWYAYTGTTPADMEGWGWERVHDPATLPEVKQAWQQSIDTGTPFEMVFPLRGADGVFRRFLTRVNPVRDARGNVVHWFGTNTDVENERRTTEANAELRARERSAREEAELLREAAETANRAKDEFLAMLGHELRNPLSPILTALQLMKLRGSDASERERTVIERQVKHLTRLVDDLLDVSRIARGKVELKEELVELAEVVAKAVEMTSPLLEERTHTLDLDVPRSGLPLRGDATRLSQVVSNLLTNAAKYTHAGGHITVRAAEDQGQVVLRVRDTGIGIAPDVLPHVFDLFVQGRQALDRSAGGLGLGLTIVRNLVEHHGGTVSAYSQGRGAGSEFVVRLPKATGVAAAGDGHVADAEAGTTVARAAGGPRVLLVDDNVDAAEMLAAALSAKGYQTRVAHDGPAALVVAETFRPEIGFLDLGLPVMDGYELAMRLRDIPDLGAIRLIAVTGYGQASDRRKTRQAGFHRHLVKPVDLGLVDKVLAGIAAEHTEIEEA
jgi:PAS domain S-box-containing protein